MDLRRSIFVVLLSWLPFVFGGQPLKAAAESTEPDAIEHFELHVRPLLANTCANCHGREKNSGGLRLDSREAILKGGDRGPAIVPGNSAGSLLVQAIRRTHDDLAMPPDDKLPAEIVRHITLWIDQGAPWPATNDPLDPFAAASHWAFQPLAAVQPTEDANSSHSAIDRFIRTQHRDKQLTAVARAAPTVLLRRAYYDLHGLPPTPADVDDFLSDKSEDAWPRLIERLLNSPRYGERWGRHWLDVVRYADTAGDNADYPVPEARLYRDYVIDCFQQDKPFNEFIREQLAGDILAASLPADDPRRRDLIIATGYLALSRRYATAPYELWHLTLEDAIDTTGRAFIGLSLRCARCHDHKYDPIPQSDYTALYGIFASTQFAWAGGEEFHSKKSPRQHFTSLLPADKLAELTAKLDGDVARRQAELEQAEAAKDERLAKKVRKRLEALQLQQRYGVPPGADAAYSVHEGTPTDAPIQLRGEPGNPGPVVPRCVPQFLSNVPRAQIPANASGRLELANWLTDPANPLTARVIVNRVWQWHFSRGMVATPSDFGLRGAKPTNRELLDWLAARFIESGWSIKALHRDLLLSETYQLANQPVTDVEAANVARDPENLYHWRFNRRRLDAESLRDTLLAVSEKLDLARPGPHPFPRIRDWKWTQHSPFKAVYDSPHRSVYLMTQRFARHPFLMLFDGPDPNTSTGLRTSSIVAPQALYLVNSPFVTEQARSLADRLIATSPDASGRITFACRICWSRSPRSDELERALQYVSRFDDELQQLPQLSPSERESEIWTSYVRVLFASHEFNYID